MIDVERRRNKIIQFKSVKSCRECVVRLIIIMFTEKYLGLTNDVVKHVINRISEIYISLNIWHMVFIQLVVCFLCPLQSSRIKNTCNVKIINHRKTLEILFLHFCHSLQCLLILQIWNKILRYLQWQWMLGKFIWWNKNSIISSTLNIHKLVFMQLYKSSQNQIAVYI